MACYNCSVIQDRVSVNETGTNIDSGVNWLYMGLAVIPMWIVFGNLLVMLAVLLQRSLHTLSNRVIASLAVTDFLLALFVVPLGIYQLVNGHWELGLYACLMWTGSDVFLSTTSILHLCVIAIYRCMGICNPLGMRSRMQGRHAATLLLLPAWGVSFTISLPLIVQGFLQREHVLIQDVITGGLQCGIFHRTFAVYSSMVSFFIPLTIMVIADIRSVVELRQNMRFPRLASPHPESIVCVSRTSSPAESIVCRSFGAVDDSGSHHSSPIPQTALPSLQRFLPAKLTGSLRGIIQRKEKNMSYINMLARCGSMRASGHERRAEKTLMWVFVCFVVLWLPFFCTNLTYGLCTTCTVPGPLFNAFTWLGYISSGVNPCIYTFLNRDFRSAFRNILMCRRQRHASWSPKSSTRHVESYKARSMRSPVRQTPVNETIN